MMKVYLLFPDQDFDPSLPLPANTEDITRDLVLDTLFKAMANGDDYLFQVGRQVMLANLSDIAIIIYRQEILKDCLQYPEVVRQLYQIPLDFSERKRKQWLWISTRQSSASAILSSSLQLLEASIDLLHRLRQIADQHVGNFASPGFRRFFTMLQRELADEYLATVTKHLSMLRLPQGLLLSAQLGKGSEGTNYFLCQGKSLDRGWFKRLLAFGSPTYSYTLHPRDEAGARMLGELRDRGLVKVANSLAQAAEHIESFFNELRFELAFYLGCLNLYEHLTTLEEPVAFPQPVPATERRFSCVGLYDITLALTMGQPLVGNDVNADGKSLLIITGANQGGKTTFLRGAGLAQLMMQSGMFVGAEYFSANLHTGLFTHFRREEDKTMESGKFQEELKRLAMIVDHLNPNALLLLNESLAATNEREGSEIAKQTISALLRKKIKVFYVTHLYEFARHFYEGEGDNVIFLRAERLADGTRTFKLKESKPLATNFGLDLYHQIFRLEKQELGEAISEANTSLP